MSARLRRRPPSACRLTGKRPSRSSRSAAPRFGRAAARAARKAPMKENADQAKIGAAMTKGEAPFDFAKARKIFATFENTAAKAPALFSENSIGQPTADDPYSASPDIWKNLDDFKARLAKLGSDAKAADTNVKDLDSFKAAFGDIGKNDCSSCHEKYRLKKS
jgi:cytochrome c556